MFLFTRSITQTQAHNSMRYDSDELLSILNFVFSIGIAVRSSLMERVSLSAMSQDSKNVSGLLQD
jgi:hypothetical protein